MFVIFYLFLYIFYLYLFSFFLWIMQVNYYLFNDYLTESEVVMLCQWLCYA